MDKQLTLKQRQPPEKGQGQTLTVGCLADVWRRKCNSLLPSMRVYADDDPRGAEQREQMELALSASHAVGAEGKQMLKVPALQPEIIEVVNRLADQSKWPGSDVIQDRAAYLEAMCQEIEDRGFSAGVIAMAVRRCAAEHDWVPSIREMLDACTAVTGEFLLAIKLLESRRQITARDMLEYGDLERYLVHEHDPEFREKFWADLAMRRGKQFLRLR